MKLLPDYADGAMPTVKYIDFTGFNEATITGKTVIVGGITYTFGGTGANSVVLQGSPTGAAINLAEAVNTNEATYGLAHNCVLPNLACIAKSYGPRCYFASRTAGGTLAITGDFTVTPAS